MYKDGDGEKEVDEDAMYESIEHERVKEEDEMRRVTRENQNLWWDMKMSDGVGFNWGVVRVFEEILYLSFFIIINNPLMDANVNNH